MNKKMLKSIGNIIFYIFASFLTMFVILELFFPSKTMDVLGFKGFVVVTDSMEPLIKVNDVVIITKLEEEDLEIGQIITFYTYLKTDQKDLEGNWIYIRSRVTHYLADIRVEENQTVIKTKSYNKYHEGGSFDAWNDENGDFKDITTDDIIGKVSLTIPFIGAIVTLSHVLVRDPIFLGLIILNIVIFTVLIKYLKKPKEKDHDVAGTDTK